MKPIVERGGNGTWNLLIDGKLVVEHESFAVVDGIRERLMGASKRRTPDELDEVAEAIRRAKEGEESE